jgi:predicted  nucleic acid-binding Zn-ribbon protein
MQKQQRKIIEGNMRNDFYRMITPVKTRISEIEKRVAILTARIAEIEALFADPNHYKDGYKVADTNREYITAKESIRSLTTEWDKLTAEAEKLAREYEEARKNTEV